jgi:hypothetical protein
MKILHIAPEHDAALVTAPVIQGIAPAVVLMWAPTPAAGLGWLQDNRDAAAVIVEVHTQSCASFIEQVRALGLTTPVVVVAGSTRLESALAALNSGADGYVVADSSLEADLPRIVAAAVARERSRQQLLTQTLTQVQQRSAAELAAAAARLADLEARHSVLLARETRISLALQQRLLELESAVRKADERRASEAVSFADQLAKRHTEFTASLAQAAQSRDAVAAELNIATAALDEARQARKTDAAAAAEQLQRREAELRAELASAIVGKAAVENALADAAAAHQDTRERAAMDLAAANERQAALEDLLAQEADRRTGVERRLAAAETARQEADHQHAARQTKAAADLAELQARYDAAVEEHAGARAAFELQTGEAASVLDRTQTDARAAQQRAAEDLAAAAARQAALEGQLSAAETARQDGDQQHALELAAAAAVLAAASTREAGLVDRLANESDARAALEHDLEKTRIESARVRNRFLSVSSTYRRRSREQKARFEEQLTGERTDTARKLDGKDEEIRQLQLEHETVRLLLGTTQNQVQHLQSTVAEERQAHERARLTSEAELQRVSAEYGQIRQSFDQLQLAFQTLEQVAGEHAAERAKLETVVADRDSQLSAQAERHRIEDQDAQNALAELQARLRQAVDAAGAEIARLQQEITALRRELEASRTHAEALRGVADRVPDLQTQLEASRNERRRQFERAPYALCRCSPGGAITEANHTFVTLLGCRHVDELRNTDFVAAALDSAGDLTWLLERARSTRKTETVETQWKSRDSRPLVVRLQALATTTGAVDIVAEDITGVRALETRLRQAQRMEAVGRLAAEVAVTCDAMLRDVARGADEWLAKAGREDALLPHVERLVTDVTRASSFLRQLGAYGNEQLRALEPASAQRVLQDLAPVLKRLVGDQIELLVPKTTGSFDVDVDAERLERVFVNVAGYARERMPSGGQVRIDLATATVGRRFAARYASVRPGEHVRITVTEVSAAGERRGDHDGSSKSSGKPGVDLGVLADLIASCGGHLWLEAQPAGNMVVKIHLPKPPATDATDRRGGRLARWFRSKSTATAPTV